MIKYLCVCKIFALCLLALSALSGVRTRSDGEPLAFETIFGTSDMRKLRQIEVVKVSGTLWTSEVSKPADQE